MRDSFTFKIGGEAGFGILTTGLLFSKTCTRSGFHIFDYAEYPSLIRGGHNVTETHFSKDSLYAQEKGVDLLAALNKQTVDLHKHELKDGAGVMYDPDQFQVTAEDFAGKNVSLFPVPLKKIVAELKGLKIMENNVALGAAVALFGMPVQNLQDVIADIFGGKKGVEIAEINKKSAQMGYDYVKSQNYHLAASDKSKTDVVGRKDYAVITDNEAVGLGAIAAGCQFYAAYPMSPSSAVLHYLAPKAAKTGMVVRHAEDEIGVINEVIGASFAGVRSMLGTSGGGFALMVEALSFAGISETALVIFLAQRPGPATGLPTWTEQGDLLFAIRAGHGEFMKIVIAPGDALEAFRFTIEAFTMADRYQTPAIVLSDKYLAESHDNIELSKLKDMEVTTDRGKWTENQLDTTADVKPFPRYQVTEDGISPRIKPGTPGWYYQMNSYEHIEDGHTTEEAHERIKQVDKRNRKLLTYLAKDFKMPNYYGSPDADITVVGWGSTKLPVLELFAREGTEIGGKKIGFLHFTHMWPMDGGRVHEELLKHKNLVLVENNSTAQLGQLLRQETGVLIEKRLLKYDGRPIYAEEVREFIKTLEH